MAIKAGTWRLQRTDLVLAGLNLVLVLVTTGWLWSLRQTELREAEVTTQATGRLLERTVKAALDKIALTVDSAADRLEDQLAAGGIDRPSLWALLDRASVRVKEIQVLAVFDRQGQQVCGPVPADRCRQLNVADRPYFKAAREQQGTGYQLHGPISSRLDGQAIVLMARPLRSPGGTFEGVAVALVPTVGLESLIRGARAYGGSAASLRTTDLTLVVRDPPLPAGAPVAPVSAALRAQLAGNPDEGSYRATTGSDGVDRISAYRRVAGWPLYVLTGSSADDVLASWKKGAWLAAAFLLVAIAGSWRLAVSIRRVGEEQRRAHYLYETAPCGYHALDAQGRFTDVNSTELAWLGKSREALVGQRSPRDFLSPESQAEFDRNFPLLAQQGHLSGLELDLVRHDGQVSRVLVHAKALRDADGHFTGSNSVMQDISALHKAQLEVRRLLEQQDVMLNNDLIGMARLQDRRITWANKAMTRLFGYSHAELIGMPMRDLYQDEATYRRVGDDSYPILRTGQFHRIEVRMRRKDGQLLWMDAGGAPLSEGAAEVLMMLTDITQKKDAEAFRLRAVELQAQNTQLIETNRLQDEFLSNMSHELRTPLNGILGFGQLMRGAVGQADADKLLRYVDQIMNSGQHLLDLVQTQLAFGRLEAGKLTLELAPVELQALLNEAAALVAQQASAARVLVSVQVAPGLGSVVSDAARLRQVVWQLASNAVKFSRPGGLVLLSAAPADGGACTVDVVDHGIGIAAADHERIFLKYTQLSAGATKKFGGVGMGLTLARRLARALGGDVQLLSSAPDQGSTFRLHLPAEATPTGDDTL